MPGFVRLSEASVESEQMENSVEATQPNPRIQAWSVLLLSRERDRSHFPLGFLDASRGRED